MCTALSPFNQQIFLHLTNLGLFQFTFIIDTCILHLNQIFHIVNTIRILLTQNIVVQGFVDITGF